MGIEFIAASIFNMFIVFCLGYFLGARKEKKEEIKRKGLNKYD